MNKNRYINTIGIVYYFRYHLQKNGMYIAWRLKLRVPKCCIKERIGTAQLESQFFYENE